jgi:chloramphenicol 3-O phosphotransferase
MSGQVVLLNGTTCSGKSTLAVALQSALPATWLILQADEVLARFPYDRKETDHVLLRALGRGFYRSIAAFSASGVRVIAEQVLQQPEQLYDCVAALHTCPVVFVGVHCSLETALCRERRRSPQQIGTVDYQYSRVHAHKTYDIEVDLSDGDLAEAVAVIADWLLVGRRPTAMPRLWEELLRRSGANA